MKISRTLLMSILTVNIFLIQAEINSAALILLVVLIFTAHNFK